jgi:AraC-like DNA-binding protein
MPLAFKKQWLSEMFASPPQHVLILLVIAVALHSFSYLAYLLKMDLGLAWNVKEVKTELRLLIIIDVLAILSIAALFVGFTFKMPGLFISGGSFLALVTVCVFLGYYRYPLFLQALKTEIEKKRYERSSLTGVDTERVHNRLMELVETEKIYTESELNLKSLAERLFITPHQLSQYLNERLGLDFRSFLNAYRVVEAKKLLAEEPDRSILSICYDVGFGSKSAFNAVFKKETGQTPREFRDTATDGQG